MRNFFTGINYIDFLGGFFANFFSKKFVLIGAIIYVIVEILTIFD